MNMLLWIPLFVFSGLYTLDFELKAFRNGEETVVSSPEMLANHVILLLQSCSVNSTGYGRHDELWNETISSGSFIHISFSDPQAMGLSNKLNSKKEKCRVDQILLPLPEGTWPTHVLVKSGDAVWMFAKYSLPALQRVVSEPALRLESVRPYDWLIGLKEK